MGERVDTPLPGSNLCQVCLLTNRLDPVGRYLVQGGPQPGVRLQGRVFELLAPSHLQFADQQNKEVLLPEAFGSVAIIPLLDDGRIVLIGQFRYAVGRRLLEVPAGTREPGEAAEDCARRELREETGYSAGRLRRLASIYPSPGILDEHMVLFVAEDLEAVGGEPMEDEYIRLVPMTIDRAYEAVLSEEIVDAKTVISILRAREAVLKDNLYFMRDAIDQYYLDKGKYPQSLRELEEEKYLRSIPDDPMTGKPNWRVIREEYDPYEDPDYEPGIWDVRSRSRERGTDRKRYSSY